jgi:site-specific recombinase XerD
MIDEFISYLEDEVKKAETTVRGYKYDLEYFNGFLRNKEVELLDVTRDIAREYLRHLNGLGLGVATVHRRIAAVKSFYRFLEANDKITANPFGLLDLPKLPERLPKWITHEQFEEMLHFPMAGDGDGYLLELRDRAILELLADTGLRVSELVGLNINDIDIEAKEVTVVGKGDKERVVPFGDNAARTVQQYLEIAQPRLSRRPNVVFVNAKGTRLSANWVQQMVGERSERALGFRITPHWLRHSCLTWMRNNGAQMADLADIAGHTNEDITRRIYAHVGMKRLHEVHNETHPRARTRKLQLVRKSC